MSDEGNVNGEVIDSPTVNSFVVGVSIVEGETAAPKTPASKGKKVTPTEPDPVVPDPEPEPEPAG